jgi:uncharacterized protein (TIGR02145 family)
MRTIGVGAKIAISLLALTSFSILLSNYSVYAEESSVSTATVTINQSCSMAGTTNTAHAANLANGTYSGSNYPNGIGQTTLRVFCNDNAGFAIYAIGYTGNEYGNTKLHSSALGSTYDINTGTYNSGSASSSTWSMKLTSVSGTYAPTIADGTNNTENFTTWHTIPTEYTKVAYRTSTTDADNNGQGTGSSLTTTYDAYVSATQPAGTYIGQVKYTLLHPSNVAAPISPLKPTDCPANSICYVPNSTDIIGSMRVLGYVSASAPAQAGKKGITGEKTTLIAPNLYRPGYGFAGWSTEWDATTATSPTIYGPNETITVGDVSTNGIILYPVWIASRGNLQDWTGCSLLEPATYDSETGKVNATLSSITALRDTRDDNVYTVARLADGKCWMVENLKLDAEDSRGDTNIAKAQGYGTSQTYGNFIGLADSEENFGNYTTANSLYSTDGSNGTINIGNDQYVYYRFPRYNNSHTDWNNTNAMPSNTGNYHWYGYGNYYTWSASMANTDNLITYNGTNGTDSVNTSICPKGWKLPLGVSSTGVINGVLQDEANDSNNRVGGFSYLDRKMGGTGLTQSNDTGESQSKKWRSFPNNIIYSGYYYSSQGYRRGSEGYYWSSSANNRDDAYHFMIMSRRVDPGDNGGAGKTRGHMLRCIAEN